MEKVLVTGGNGFIGSHIVDELVKRSYEVICIDNLSGEANEEFYFNDKASYFKEDITNFDKIKDKFTGISYVFHLAAESRIGPTLENPIKAAKTNFIGTCNVLQASRDNNVKRVVYSSTSSAYGLKNKPPLKESFHRDCINPYAVTKVAGEDLCKMYYSLWKIPTVILRYFNVYGERHPSTGQYAPVIGIFNKQKKKDKPLTIVGDGSQKRDFVNVIDVVKANMTAMETKNEKCFGEIFNVGTGSNISIQEIADLISSNQSYLKNRLGEAKETLADINKTKDVLGFQASLKVQDWIKENT